MDELELQYKQVLNGEKTDRIKILLISWFYNVIPQIDVFTDNGF